MAGLRFDKVDPRLYVELGQNIGRAYDQRQAANAGLAAQQEQTRMEPGTAEAIDPNGLAPEGYTPDPGRQQYGLGASPTTYQDTPYTPEQKRVAGLQGQMDYYIAKGNTDKADKLREQIFAAEKNRMDTESHQQNMKLGEQRLGLGASELARKQEEDTAHAEASKNLQNASAFLFGSPIAGPTPAAVPDGEDPNSVAAQMRAAPGEHAATGIAQQMEGERQALAMRFKEAFAQRDSKAQAGIIAEAQALQQKSIGVQAAAKWQAMTPEDQKNFAYNVTQQYGGDVAVTVPDHNGYMHVSLGKPDPKTGQTVGFVLTPAETFKFFHASELLKNGFVAEAQDLMDKGGANLKAIQNEHNKLTIDTVKTNNTGITEQRTSSAALQNAASNAKHVDSQVKLNDSTIKEREAEAKRKDDAIKAIDTLMPDLNAALRGGDKATINNVITKMAADSARTSGDASKLLNVLRDRASALSGRKQIGKIEKSEDGFLVFDTDNKLTEFLTPSGLSLPPGMNEARYNTALADAKSAGVRAELGYDDGHRALQYAGASGQYYPTVAEAKADKRAPAKADTPAPTSASPRATAASATPVRSTDGGRSYQLDIPETVRDPSVPYYRPIKNPMYVQLGNKSFGSRAEAEAAYAAATGLK